jgi:hypothetical protein
MPLQFYRRAFMNIEDLKKRKELLETNLKQVNDRITQDTQQALRIQGALLDVNEIIAEDEKKLKEDEGKKPDKKVK